MSAVQQVVAALAAAAGGGSGVLTSVAYTPATSRNLTTDGTTDWAWLVDISGGNPLLRSKATASGGSGLITGAFLGGGTHNTTTLAVTYTISDGQGSGFSHSDTSNSGIYQNMDASTGGFTLTVPIGTTQRTVDVEFGGGTGTLTLTPTLSDGSATLAPFTISNGSNLGRRFTVKAGAASQTLTLVVSSTTGAGGDFIRMGAVVVY